MLSDDDLPTARPCRVSAQLASRASPSFFARAARVVSATMWSIRASTGTRSSRTSRSISAVSPDTTADTSETRSGSPSSFLTPVPQTFLWLFQAALKQPWPQ